MSDWWGIGDGEGSKGSRYGDGVYCSVFKDMI